MSNSEASRWRNSFRSPFSASSVRRRVWTIHNKGNTIMWTFGYESSICNVLSVLICLRKSMSMETFFIGLSTRRRSFLPLLAWKMFLNHTGARVCVVPMITNYGLVTWIGCPSVVWCKCTSPEHALGWMTMGWRVDNARANILGKNTTSLVL